MIIADTSGLLAGFHNREPRHHDVVVALDGVPDLLVVSPLVVAELDYMVSSRWGFDVELSVLRRLSSGAYELPHLEGDDLSACADVVERYRDQDIGVADASLVVLAKRYDTRRILTLDRRHFEVLRPLQGGRFQIVP